MGQKQRIRSLLYKAGIKHCFCCGEEIKTLSCATIEHILPRSLGGGNQIYNLSLSHSDCNRIRGNDLEVPFAFSNDIIKKTLYFAKRKMI